MLIITVASLKAVFAVTQIVWPNYFCLSVQSVPPKTYGTLKFIFSAKFRLFFRKYDTLANKNNPLDTS